MDTVWGAEADAIQWLQRLGEWLSYPLLAVTELGSETVVIAVLALVFWSVHAGVGARLFVLVIASGVVNAFLKTLLYGSRPYWHSGLVVGYATEATFGLPSGHAQGSTVLYGYLGIRSGRRAWFWGAVGLIAVICFSRIYLGVHFFSDVVVGVLLGVAILWAFFRWERPVLRWWRSLALRTAALYALAASLVPCAVAALWALAVRGPWSAPQTDVIGRLPQDPVGDSLTGLFLVAGAFFGGAVGLTLLADRGWYSARGTLVQRAARFVLGISVVLVVQIVADLFLRELSGLAEAVPTYLLYAAIAFWATFAAPRMFLDGGLAQRPEPEPEGGPEPGADTGPGTGPEPGPDADPAPTGDDTGDGTPDRGEGGDPAPDRRL
ncbi:phosphatase PAP2 family protein [Nocardiopsis sp. HNM0947]|uniref:Phosphatase PAP2 family protein n=2 Tax=Nocardiopsis coralli TaxID=2772213 RepID=A0ABR9P0Q4_9ACTN|nr:phosphatase PAP2 family protein [Nocardiopsis coralli]